MDGLSDSEPPASTEPAEAAGRAKKEVESAPKAAAPDPAQPPRGASRQPLVHARAEEADGQWSGRVAFDDLFAVEKQPRGVVRGGPEVKVEFLRDKLKRAEGQISRFRQAWQVREQEIDRLEALREQSRRQRDEDAGIAQQLRAFIETKKHELEAYGQKVAQSFRERDEADKKLKAEHAAALAALQAGKEEMGTDLRREIEKVEEELHQENVELESSLRKEKHEAFIKNRSDREELAERLKQEYQDREETLRSEVRRALREASARADEFADTQGPLERELRLRDDAIAKLKRMVERQRETLEDKEQQLEDCVALAEQADAQGAQGAAAQQESIRMRDQAIAKVKQELKKARQALEAHQREPSARRSETDTDVDEFSEETTQSSGAAQKKIHALVERIADQTDEIDRLRAAADGPDEKSLAQVQVAFEVIQGLLDDLRDTIPGAFDESNRIGEALVRVHKAVILGAKASKSI